MLKRVVLENMQVLLVECIHATLCWRVDTLSDGNRSSLEGITAKRTALKVTQPKPDGKRWASESCQRSKRVSTDLSSLRSYLALSLDSNRRLRRPLLESRQILARSRLVALRPNA
jgi:hypothetical protein